MSARILLNLLNELEKSDKMRGLPSILSVFCNKFNPFKLNEIFHCYQLYQSISILRDVGW